MHAQALAEDPTIFDYDTAHDLMQEQQRQQGPAAAFTGGGSATPTAGAPGRVRDGAAVCAPERPRP